jgi:outer membrane protein assembly factor BamD (BamD/ComL family)
LFFEQAKEYGVEEAQAQIDAITAQVDAETAKGLKYLEEKNTARAHVLFQNIIRVYGESITGRAKEELNKIENDPIFVNEKKAAELFLQIRNNYKAAGKTQTVTSLKKLIDDYPDTSAAERAKTTLENMGM